MVDYELIVTGRGIAERSDDIYSHFDALIAGHSGVTLLTVTATGSDILEAGQLAIKELENLGDVVVDRLYPDLVSRSDIAERAEVTPQTVSNWVRGTRRGISREFPVPYSFVSGGVWLWGDVRSWLTEVGIVDKSDIRFPTLAEHEELSSWLQERRAHHKSRTWQPAPFPYGGGSEAAVTVKVARQRVSGHPRTVLRYFELQKVDSE